MRDEEDTVDYPASWVESGEPICARGGWRRRQVGNEGMSDWPEVRARISTPLSPGPAATLSFTMQPARFARRHRLGRDRRQSCGTCGSGDRQARPAALP